MSINLTKKRKEKKILNYRKLRKNIFTPHNPYNFNDWKMWGSEWGYKQEGQVESRFRKQTSTASDSCAQGHLEVRFLGEAGWGQDRPRQAAPLLKIES